jgi:hypothetical protein
MPVIINGTTGISGVDGSAGTPAFQGSDANTGIRFGTDIVSLVTGGSDRLYIDSSGRLGVGTTSPDRIFHLYGSVSFPARLESTGTNVLLDFKTSANVALSTSCGAISDAFAINTNASERFRIDSSGRVGIGTTAPGAELHVNPGAGNVGNIYLDYGTGSSTDGRLNIEVGSSAVFYETIKTGGLAQAWYVAGSERARIDTAGRLLVGTSTSRGNWYNSASGEDCALQIEGNGGNSLSLTRNIGNTSGPFLNFGKSRGTANGSNTAVQSGDILGTIDFQGTDGSEMVEAAFIRAEVDGTPGANDMPGRLVFSTTADGASSPTERMRVNNKGTFAFATTDTSLGGTPTAIFAQVPAVSGSATQQPICVWNSGTSGTRYMMAFADGSTFTERGYITWNGTTMALSNASDERLKKNIVAAPSASVQLQQIQVRSFDFVEDNAHVKYGFVAQELNEIAPEAVVVGEDNEDGTVNKYWGVSNANLVPMLTKALQEALTEIETLKAKVAALEAA